ncbi:hypothetical protein Drorol1_Dr00010153 [Drosera rotundifolia]
MQDMWNGSAIGFRPSKSAPCSPAKPIGVTRTRSESFHVAHKVPVGDTPYVRAKHVLLPFSRLFPTLLTVPNPCLSRHHRFNAAVRRSTLPKPEYGFSWSGEVHLG